MGLAVSSIPGLVCGGGYADGMPLVPFPDTHSNLLVHIAALTKELAGHSDPVSLSVRIRLSGMTEIPIKLGTYPTVAAAEARWEQLVTHLGDVVQS